jgi:dTDP-4-amino-4,6-dideoxygalactose transaminase
MSNTMFGFSEEDLEVVKHFIKTQDISGWFGSKEGGTFMQMFQSKFAQIAGCDYGYATSSGSTAIYSALRAVGVKSYDRVLVPTYTHIGTVAPILLCGAVPLFVDCDMYGNIDPVKIKEAIERADTVPTALVVVHQLGSPARMKEIRESLYPFDIKIVEDASHAMFAEYEHKRCGSLGDIAAFSVGGGRTKTIGTGEGGVVTTNSEELAERVKAIRNHGDRYAGYPEMCFNFRMSELQALLGLLQLPRAKAATEIQIENAHRIIKEVKDSRLEFFEEPSNVKDVHYMVRFCWKDPMSRGIFLDKLSGILSAGYEFKGAPRMNVGPGYSILIHTQRPYKFSDNEKVCFPTSEHLLKRAIWVDWHRPPRDQEDVNNIIDVMKRALQ